jgi:flavin-dependent dehydrogenase/ubiquinone/menaquinone biosynthesis C-methylase UbiE
MLLARKGYRVLLVDRATFPSDTMSTHYIHHHGVSRLESWGLLEELEALNCPQIRKFTIDFGEFALTGVPPPVNGIDAGYCPRRRLLDKMLVDAAVSAGAELREDFSVQDVVFDGDRAVGIRGRVSDGPSIAEKARVVIGADGLHSRVARAVSPREYWTRPTLECAYYTYWSGVPLDGFEIYRSDRRMVFAAPTNDGLACIGVAWPIAEWSAYKASVEANYLATIDRTDLRERVRNGRREERFVGTARLPNYYRRPFGPGWALVGDAGFHKDPTTASGISDAFRDAEFLAIALDKGFSRIEDPMRALAQYERKRNRETLHLYNLYTKHISALEPLPPEFIEYVRALRGNQPAIDRLLGVLVGAVEVRTVLSARHMVSMIGVRGVVRALRARASRATLRGDRHRGPPAIVPTRVRAEYNRIAPVFCFGSALIFPHRARLIVQQVLPRLALRGGETVLDLGCGAGHNFPHLRAAIGAEGNLVGVDLSENMLALARHRVEEQRWRNVGLVLGNANDLKFLRPQSIDVVFCSLSFAMLPDRLAALEAIATVLKRGGRLAIIDWQPFSGWWRFVNPLIYLSMSGLPSSNTALFKRAPESAALVTRVFPNAEYSEHYAGSLYVVIAATGAARVSQNAMSEHAHAVAR